MSLSFLKNGSTISFTSRPSEQMAVLRQREPVAIWHETVTKLNKQRRFAKTKQQESIIRQQLSAREASIQIGKGGWKGRMGGGGGSHREQQSARISVRVAIVNFYTAHSPPATEQRQALDMVTAAVLKLFAFLL